MNPSPKPSPADRWLSLRERIQASKQKRQTLQMSRAK